MRVAVLTHNAYHGAFATIARNIATGLTALGVDVDVLYLQGPEPALLQPQFADGVHLVYTGGRSRTCWWAVARHLRRHRPDALISLGWVLNPSAVVARLVAGGPTALILNEQSSLSYKTRVEHRAQLRLRVLEFVARALYPRADAITGASAAVVADLIEQIGLDARRNTFEVVPNAVDGDYVRRMAREPDPDLVDAGTRPVFVNVARHARQKNLPLLLEAFRRYRAQGGPATLVLIGGGPDSAGLRRLAGDLGIADDVVFRGAVLNPYPQMAAATAFVLSSEEEGFGLVLVEAMCLGTPVISTDCPGGPQTILDDGRAGVLVPSGDPDALAAALNDLAEDAELARSLGERARGRAHDFDPVNVGKLWSALVEEVQIRSVR